MHEETESAEAILNPMIRETTTLDFCSRSLSGSSHHIRDFFAQIQVEHQINPVLKVLFIFCTRWRAYRVASAAVFSDGPKSLCLSSHLPQTCYIFGERMSNNLASHTQRPSDRQADPDGANATFFCRRRLNGSDIGHH
jgi:hypothetical protein